MKVRILALGAAMLGASLLLTAPNAKADWHDHDGGGDRRGWYDGYRHWHWYAGYGPGYGYYPPPPPVYYAPPPPVYYAPPPPPPVYYAPPPVYYAPPGITVGITP
jgi:hypothetical protein